MNVGTVLVVDDEKLIRWSLRQRLEQDGHTVVEAENTKTALRLAPQGVDVILLDNRLPDGEGMALLPVLRQTAPDAVVIMLTAHGSIELAVEAMHQGAWHYLRKPLHLSEVSVLIQKALQTKALYGEVQSLRATASGASQLTDIVGLSPAILAARALLQKVARTSTSTILLGGESGTGKDLAARVIHHASDRARKPFLNITSSALPENLLESELFGHEKGAFTDAKAQKKGLLESAEGGTVFLDEIGEMSLPLQAKLLRFLEDKTFRRVGGSQEIRVDVRVIAATNRNLQAEVQAGRFREDLFYRLQVLPVTLPPLRDRHGDIELLAGHFRQRFAQEFHKTVTGIEPAAMRMLALQRWPGNVRELKNAVERAVLLTESNLLTADDFLMAAPARSPDQRLVTLPEGGVHIEAVERDLVVQAIERTRGNQTRAAQLLGISRDQLRYRLDKLDRPVATEN